MVKTNGFKFMVIFLKAQYVNQQQALGGSPLKDLSPLKCRFARNNQGIPRIIPAIHRKRIREGDLHIIRLWLSLFSIYRVFTFPYKLKLDSIINESTNITGTQSLQKEFTVFVPIFIEMLYSHYKTRWQDLLRSDRREAMNLLKVKVFFTNNSSSSYKGVPASSPLSLLSALLLWGKDPSLVKALKVWTRGTNSFVFNTWFNQGLKHVKRILVDDPKIRTLGRLGFKEEAAGKQRVFAMQDIITQWAFKGLHTQIFEILRLIPQDGTFDQIAPVNLLLSKIKESGLKRPLYSLDLSAATDRLPVQMAEILLAGLVGTDMANAWKVIQTARDFHYRYQTESSSVRYKVGQPMGALTSWAMGLTLLHHAIIQFSAFKAGWREWFPWYALLGDDILIADAMVSEQYRRILDSLGVECGIAKSVVSRKGTALEFAKRFIYKGNDLSPIPLKEVLTSARGFGPSMEQARKFGLSLSGYIHLLGYGYKSQAFLGAPMTKQPKRLRNAVQSYYMGLGGFPLNPLYREDQDSIRQSVLDSYRNRLLYNLDQSLLIYDHYPKIHSIYPYFRVGPSALCYYGFEERQPANVLASFTNRLDSENIMEADLEAYLWICETYEEYYHKHMFWQFHNLTELRKKVSELSLSDKTYALNYSQLLVLEDEIKKFTPFMLNISSRKSDVVSFRPNFLVKTYGRFLLNK